MRLAESWTTRSGEPRGNRLRLAAFLLTSISAATCLKADDGLPGASQASPRVKAKAYLSVKKLPPGGKCEIIVLLNVQSGWHINSNSVVKEWQIPTELTVSSKLGTRLARIDYPKGRPERVPGSEEPVPVFERQVTIRGELAVPREAAGQTEDFRIQVRYQACNDHECEQPKVLKLSGKVAIAADGESVEEANSNLFPRSR